MKAMIKSNWRLGFGNYNIAEELNTAYEAGFRYMCNGNNRTTEGIDPWSGMPNTTSDVFVFTTKEEAEAFALEQKGVFNKDIHSTVYNIPAHTMDWDEIREAEKAAEEAKKAKKIAKELAKAEAAGMTLDEYRAEQKRIRKIKNLKKEIEALKKELDEKEAYLKKLEG